MEHSEEKKADEDDRLEQNSPPRGEEASTSSIPGNSVESDSKPGLSFMRRMVSPDVLQGAICISSCAVLGVALRVFLSRIFGEDCENGDDSVQDFLTPLSSRLCITSGGRTAQTGGGLFRDLPSNLLGSFIMGFLNSHRHKGAFPWLEAEHPLQQNTALISGLKVGFCGCLTTFASWNTQMVVMMDGSYTLLGPQVLAALFGYALGLSSGVSSFRFGREVSHWIFEWVHNGNNSRPNADKTTSSAEACPRGDDAQEPTRRSTTLPYLIVLPILSALVLVATLIGYFVNDISFYRSMALMLAVAPVGALNRWALSNWNASNARSILPWLPLGTFAANLTAAIISIVCQGVLDRYSPERLEENDWSFLVLVSIRVGYAGSLSTVSSMVGETVKLEEKYIGQPKSFLYGFMTCTSSMIICLMSYMIIVRTNN